MSKIEVVRVPDGFEIREGKLAPIWFPARYKPALLAALLEDAGAIKTEVYLDSLAWPRVRHEDTRSLEIGPYWLLPIPEDTE